MPDKVHRIGKRLLAHVTDLRSAVAAPIGITSDVDDQAQTPVFLTFCTTIAPLIGTGLASGSGELGELVHNTAAVAVPLTCTLRPETRRARWHPAAFHESSGGLQGRGVFSRASVQRPS